MTTSNSRCPEDADAGDPRARARRDHRGDRRQGRASLASMSAIGSPSRLCCLVTRHLPGRPLPPVRRPADLFLHPVVEHAGLWGAYAQYMYLAPNTIVHKMDKTCRPSSQMFNPLGAGFRWAVEISQTQVTTRSSYWDRASAVWPASCRAAGGCGKIIVTAYADARKLDSPDSAHHTIDKPERERH